MKITFKINRDDFGGAKPLPPDEFKKVSHERILDAVETGIQQSHFEWADEVLEGLIDPETGVKPGFTVVTTQDSILPIIHVITSSEDLKREAESRILRKLRQEQQGGSPD